MGKRIGTQQEFMQGLVIFRGAVVTGLLSEPFTEGLFRFRQGEGIGIDYDGGIELVGYLIDEQVVVAAGQMIDGGEAFVPEKNIFFIGEVSADAHIRDACQGVGEVLQRCVKGIEADDLVEEAGVFLVGAITQHYFDAIIVSVLHLLHPEFAGWHTVCVGQQDDLVFGFLDAHAQRIFFSGDADGFLFKVDYMESFEGFFELVEEEAGIVLAVVIDDDHFMGAGIGLYQGSGEVCDKFGGFIPGADDDADGVLLGLIFGGW